MTALCTGGCGKPVTDEGKICPSCWYPSGMVGDTVVVKGLRFPTETDPVLPDNDDSLIQFERVHIVTIQGDRRSYATVLPEGWSYPPKGRETFQCSECGTLVIDQDVHLLFHLRAEGKQ